MPEFIDTPLDKAKQATEFLRGLINILPEPGQPHAASRRIAADPPPPLTV